MRSAPPTPVTGFATPGAASSSRCKSGKARPRSSTPGSPNAMKVSQVPPPRLGERSCNSTSATSPSIQQNSRPCWSNRQQGPDWQPRGASHRKLSFGVSLHVEGRSSSQVRTSDDRAILSEARCTRLQRGGAAPTSVPVAGIARGVISVSSGLGCAAQRAGHGTVPNHRQPGTD